MSNQYVKKNSEYFPKHSEVGCKNPTDCDWFTFSSCIFKKYAFRVYSYN